MALLVGTSARENFLAGPTKADNLELLSCLVLGLDPPEEDMLSETLKHSTIYKTF